MEPQKQCPDCAEMVRAEARVCRFCGYRFDGARRDDRRGGGSSSATGALADLLRRPKAARSLAEILENWGLKLIALLLSVTLWLAVHGDPSTERTITVPLEILNQPRNLEITSDRPSCRMSRRSTIIGLLRKWPRSSY